MNKELFKAIPENYIPKNILVIRFHSIGDIAITFPYLNSLKNLYRESNIDFLSSKEYSTLPASLDIIRNTFYINLESDKNKNIFLKLKKYFRALRLGSLLRKQKYDVLIDLQNNKLSRIIRKSINPEYFVEFDKFSALSAGIRVQNTLIKLGFNNPLPDFKLRVSSDLLAKAKDILLKSGWNKTKKIFVLNPAGLWVTRNWLIENYVKLARIISSNYDSCFLMLGTERIKDKAKYITSYLGNNVINLANKTTIPESFAILQFASAVISEDSGLMHMAWVSGIPTVALLGSSRADWISPLGEHSVSLNSSDLECGNCMSPECKFNDVHCLTRYTPEFVYAKLETVLRK